MTSEPFTSQESENALEPEQLIQEYQASVWRYLRAMGCEQSLADDLTQETFIAVLRRPFVQISPSATASYLRRVAYHLLVTYRRKHRRMTTTDVMDALDEQWVRWAGEEGRGGEVFDALAECFSRLTARAQLSLKMRFSEDATRENIAQKLGITEHGAKNLMQRAKAQLRQCMDGKLQGD
ncbi:RNA polymerase sigma factor [Pirellulaceae bacterium SH467]